MTDQALVVRRCSKSFAGRRVLIDVDLDVERGEIHALLGQNGSGKSTLIKCLSGYHSPDPGARIQVGGEELDIPFLPAHVLRAGLRFVHQDLAIVPTLSVTENLGLGSGLPTTRSGRVDWSTAHSKERSRWSPGPPAATEGHRTEAPERGGAHCHDPAHWRRIPRP